MEICQSENFLDRCWPKVLNCLDRVVIDNHPSTYIHRSPILARSVEPWWCFWIKISSGLGRPPSNGRGRWNAPREAFEGQVAWENFEKNALRGLGSGGSTKLPARNVELEMIRIEIFDLKLLFAFGMQSCSASRLDCTAGVLYKWVYVEPLFPPCLTLAKHPDVPKLRALTNFAFTWFIWEGHKSTLRCILHILHPRKLT